MFWKLWIPEFMYKEHVTSLLSLTSSQCCGRMPLGNIVFTMQNQVKSCELGEDLTWKWVCTSCGGLGICNSSLGNGKSFLLSLSASFSSRERRSIFYRGFTPQMVPKATAGPGSSQEPGVSFTSPTRLDGPKHLGCLWLLS